MVSSKKLSLSILCMVFLSAIVLSSVSAEESSNYFYGLEVVNTTEKKIQQDNDVELTFSEMELKGNEEDLKELIKKLKSEDRDIISVNPVGDDQISPMALGAGTYKGSICVKQNETNLCNYPNVYFSLRSGGFLGATFDGQILSINAPDTGAKGLTNLKTQPRLKVVAYGLTGGDTIVVGTYDYKSPEKKNLVDWTVKENPAGVFAYVEFYMGADYTYEYYGVPKNDTIWAPIERQ
ncbi:Uncharacterised protein [Actinobacillus pleuropneumoniae]|nr:Uncharacterised protein [Actinobacillus pleuropneumoniae]